MRSPESEPSDDGLPALSDESLMEAFYNRGDRAAIQELHRRYQTKLAGVFLSQGVRREEVEDLVNETWLRVLRTFLAQRPDSDRGIGGVSRRGSTRLPGI